MTFKASIEGRVYEGWTVASIERSLSEFAHRITLNYVDRWAPEGVAWPIRRGNSIVPSWEGQPYTAGRVDISRMTVDENAWRLSVVARSFSGVLVQGSAVHETGHWTNATALQIAKDVCAPYGIAVTCRSPGDPLPRFAIRQGESVCDLLGRLCKIRALLPITTPSGEVELFSVASALELAIETPVLALQVDQALSRDYTDDGTGRHSEYLLSAIGVEDHEDAFEQHTATDLEIEHFCPLVVVSDAAANASQMETRAIWEANIRAARGETLTYVFQSPVNIAGRLYRPGQRYRVTDDAFGVDTTMLLHKAVDTPHEMRTEVSFVRPEAYAIYNVVGKARKRLVRASRRPKRTRRPGLL